MPDSKTTDDPKTEPLDLRLLRDVLDEHGIPLDCWRRQCRRNRHCSGEAQRADQPLTPGEALPPCVAKAKAEARRQLQTMADGLRPPVDRSPEPRQWPDDHEAADRLRTTLAIIHRIHTRPGPHPEHERAAIAAWAASDPNPQLSAVCRRIWRHTKGETKPRANPGSAPS
ncbi:hypothetical protein SAMN05880561_10661 [Rhizobium sp. RU33A]|uniref:hypothetical protein n=1 Tax=Rhizobium sp. RU33A TaxID=1907413 RepID=UPI00095679AF|nr:hypothetical protein [Rhizobium sp. RU33A]SIQ93425.1 hypothetical protein SAMN05880561_10661 [Rhizobium sp. RU33A]